jgi:hypothetical protein
MCYGCIDVEPPIIRWQTSWTLSIVWWWFKIHDVSETGICLRQGKVPTLMGPIERASLNLRTWWRRQITVSETSCIFNHYQTMDNVHEVCHLNSTKWDNKIGEPRIIRRDIWKVEIRRWIMSMKFVILTNHRHKPSEFTNNKLQITQQN